MFFDWPQKFDEFDDPTVPSGFDDLAWRLLSPQLFSCGKAADFLQVRRLWQRFADLTIPPTSHNKARRTARMKTEAVQPAELKLSFAEFASVGI